MHCSVFCKISLTARSLTEAKENAIIQTFKQTIMLFDIALSPWFHLWELYVSLELIPNRIH